MHNHLSVVDTFDAWYTYASYETEQSGAIRDPIGIWNISGVASRSCLCFVLLTLPSPSEITTPLNFIIIIYLVKKMLLSYM